MKYHRLEPAMGITKLLAVISAIICISMLFSCASKVPFTSDLKEQYNISEKTLKKIQFYTSQEIVLMQSGGESYMQTYEGKILVNNTARESKIVIPKNTPCTIEKTLDSTRVIVAFEYGEGKVLIFGVNSIGTYSLFAKKWMGRDGVVEYGNSTYTTANGSGASVLNVKLKKLNQYRNKERTISGKRI